MCHAWVQIDVGKEERKKKDAAQGIKKTSSARGAGIKTASVRAAVRIMSVADAR